MIRFHLDQHVSSAIAIGLQLRGIDVTTTADAGLQGAEDSEHLLFALREERVVFTQDSDFPRLHSAGVKHAGIVYSKQHTRSIGEIVHFLVFLSQCLEPSDMRGRLEYF